MNTQTSEMTPFLTFLGQAEEAMNFYAATFPDATIDHLQHFTAGQPGDEGKVIHGQMTIMGSPIMFLDMQAGMDTPAFTWTTSFYLHFTDEAAYDAVFDKLAAEGHVMMQEAPFMAFRKVAWVTDKFGITWQPVLE